MRVMSESEQLAIEARKEKGKALVDSGMSLRKAAKELGVSYQTVSNDTRDVSPPPRPDPFLAWIRSFPKGSCPTIEDWRLFDKSEAKRAYDKQLFREGKRAARSWIMASLRARQTQTPFQSGFDAELRRQRQFLVEMYGHLLWTPCCESCPHQQLSDAK